MITAIVIRQPKKADWLDVPIVSGNIWIGLRLVKKFTPFQCHGRGASSTKKVYGNTTTIETIFKGLHKYSRPRLQTYQPKGRDGGGVVQPERKIKTPLHLRLTTNDWVECFKQLTRAELGVFYYIRTLDPYGDRELEIDCSKVGELLGIHRTSVSRALEELVRKGFLNNRYSKTVIRDNVERQVCTRLHMKLGGLVEVTTPSGRLDLLTETEIIEVKRINEWKSALGQILIYSAFYPQHQKRLHLFGTAKELEVLPDIEAAVLSFAVKVTGEEVEK